MLDGRKRGQVLGSSFFTPLTNHTRVMTLHKPDEAGFSTEQEISSSNVLLMSRIIIAFNLSVGFVGGPKMGPTDSVTSDKFLKRLNSSFIHQIHSDKSCTGPIDAQSLDTERRAALTACTRPSTIPPRIAIIIFIDNFLLLTRLHRIVTIRDETRPPRDRT